MPPIILPPPSELPHEGGQILEFPILARELLDDLSYSLIVEIKEMCHFGQTLKLEIRLPSPLPSPFSPYMKDNFLLRVQVNVLGALAYHAFDPPEFANFYMNVLYPQLPPGYPDPCKFINTQYHEKNLSNNPFPLYLSSIPPPVGGAAYGLE